MYFPKKKIFYFAKYYAFVNKSIYYSLKIVWYMV